MPAATDVPPSPVPPPARRGRRPLAIILGVLLVALAAMWVYAFFFAPRGSPDKMEDAAWAEQADGTCSEYQARVEALPPARQFADVQPREEALRQRAGVLDQATGVLADMVRDLRADEPADAKGREGVTLWLADWDQYLADRRTHAEQLRAGVDEVFVVKAVGGLPLTERMDAFARVNGMDACQVPLDV